MHLLSGVPALLQVTGAYKRNNQRVMPGFIDIPALPPLPADEAARATPQQQPKQQPQQQPYDPNFVDPQQPQPRYNPNSAPGYMEPRHNNNRRNNSNNGGGYTFNDTWNVPPPSQRGGWNRGYNNNARTGGFVGFDDPADSMLLQVRQL